MKILLLFTLLTSSYAYRLTNTFGANYWQRRQRNRTHTNVSCDREIRSTDKVEELKAKLAKLQGLLKGLDLDDNAVTDVHDVSDTDAKSLAALDQSKERTTTKKEVDTGETPNMKLKKFVDSMTPRDVQTLREIKRMLEIARERRMKPDVQDQDAGTFADDEASSEEEGEKRYDWRDLARDLRAKKEAFYLQKKMNEEPFREDPLSVKSEEGSFGAFREEIKESVEKNLLSDIALAIHSGISVDEIIGDLTEPETPRGDSGWWKRD